MREVLFFMQASIITPRRSTRKKLHDAVDNYNNWVQVFMLYANVMLVDFVTTVIRGTGKASNQIKRILSQKVNS